MFKSGFYLQKIKNNHPIKVLAIAVLALSSVLFSPSVLAHKVNMFAYSDGIEVFVEGYFTDGKKPKNSEIKVFDSSNVELLVGQADDEGAYHFKIPSQQDMRITLNAGEGHMTEYMLTAEELGAENEPDNSSIENSEVSEVGIVAAETELSNASVPSNLQPMINKAVGRSIKPLMRGLSELKEQRTFSDIVGGLGFIVGIIGVFYYVKARKLLNEKKA